ncbi:MAG TPA: SIS domain-containing protein [Polyangia bacterium]|nr:SIS domain-containing protein [Polyangia bacterium]
MIDSILKKARESADTQLRFFEANAARIAACAEALAARVREGGRVLTMGNGGSACDAQHLAVEFQHPIIEKRRALPAQCLSSDTALLTAIGNDTDFARAYCDQLELVARPVDVAIGVSTSGASANVNRALKRARQLGLLTIGFAGRDGGALADLCEHAFVVPSWSIHRIQETHTILLHVLWDQLHVALGEDDVL